MKVLDNSFYNYIFIGVLNTVVGFGSITFFMYEGLAPEISNFIGYAIGICFSFLMNKRYNFKTQGNYLKEFAKFFGSMGIAYMFNFATLILLFRGFYLNKYISQMFASIVYVIVGYMLSKIYVFKNLN